LGNLSQTTCYRRNVTSGSCGTVSTNTITVTVYANLTAGNVAADQSICYNTTPAQFTSTTDPGGGTGSYMYQWQIQTGCSGGWSDIGGATSNIYLHTTALTQTTCFKRNVTSGACGTVSSNIITVTVYADLTSGSIGSNQTICYNTPPAAFTQTVASSGGTGSYTYQWQNQPGCSGGWGDISGATATTYQAVPITQTTCYRRNVTSGSCGTLSSNTITVSVYANLTPGSVASDQSLCYNTSPAVFSQTFAVNGGTGSYNYQWQIQPGCSGAWSDISGATATTYDDPGNLIQTTCYRRNVTSGSCGTVATNTITVTVYGDLNGGIVAASQTICYNQNIAGFTNSTSPSGGTGIYNYQWQIQPGCSGAWSDLPGATSDIYSYPSALIQSTCFRRKVTNPCGTVYSNTITITVNPLPAVSFSGLTGPYCISQITPVPLTGSPAGGTFSGNGISGNNFTPYYAAVGSNTITYTYTNGNFCTNSTSQIVTIIGLPNVDFSGLGGPYCVDNNNPVALTGYPTGGTFSGAGISGNTFIPSLAGVGVHSITYTYSDANGCTNSKTYTAVVNALPAVTFSGLEVDYCINSSPSTLTGFPLGGTFSGAGISGNVFNPTIAGIGPHTITYTYSDAIGCINFTQQITTVHNLPIVSFSGLNANYCYEATAALLTGNPAGGTFSGNGVSGNYFYPSVSGEGTINITYTYTDGFSCLNTSMQATTVYGQLLAGTVGNSQTICYNSAPAAFVNIATATGGSLGTTYQWQQQPGCIGAWSDIAGATASTCNSTGILTQTTCFRRLALNACGSVVSNTVEVYVFADLTSGIVASDQTICSNTSPAAFTQFIAPTGGNGSYTYQWQEQPGCSGAWSDISGATASTYDVPGNITQTTCYRRKVVSGASCGTVYTNTITVTIFANITPGTIGTDQTICYNSTPATFTNVTSPTGGTGFYVYQWQIQPGCSGPWSDISGATSDVYTQTTPITQTSCFRRKVSSGACGTDYSNAITVTVHFDLSPGAVAANQTICYNSSPAAFTEAIAPAGGNGIYSYQWQSQPGCNGGWGDISGATASTYDDPGNVTQITCYRRLVASGSCGTIASAAITVTVYADLTSGAVAADQTLCYKTPPATFTQTTAPSGGDGTYTYQWQVQPGCTGAWSDISGATATTYNDPTNLTITTCYRRQVISGSLCGSAYTNVITATVLASLSSGSIASDQTICYNSTPATFTNVTSPTGGSGFYTYHWQIRPGCTGAWSNIPGATSDVYTQTTPIIQNTCYRREVTSGSCGIGYSNTLTVTVFVNLTPGTVTSDQTICYNTSPAAFTELLAPSGGNGSYTYQWQSQPGCTGGWGDISGAIASTYDVPGNITQTTCYRRQVISGACGSIASAALTVTVYADLTSGSVAADQTICYNTSPSPFTQTIASTGGNGTYTYQWQEQPGCTGIWTDITGATATTYDVPGTVNQTTCYRREVTSGTCGTVATSVLTVTVFGTLNPGAIAADQTICYNAMPATFTNVTSPSGGNGFFTYQWQVQPGCSGVWTDIAGATSDIYTQTSPIMQNTCYRRKVTSGTCGTDYSNVVTVTVYTILTPGVVIADQIICYNTAPAAFTQSAAPTGGNGSYTYQWQSQPGCIGGWGDISGATASTYQAGNIILTTCYRRELIGGSCGAVASPFITVTVYADLTSGSVAADQTICYNTSPSPFTQITASTGGNFTYIYQWQEQPGCTGAWTDLAGATATTYDVPGNLTQTTCYRRRVTSGTCGTVSTAVLTVTVFGTLNPGAIAADQTICYNSMPTTFTNAISPSGGIGFFTYQWQVQPGCSGAWTNIVGATSDIYTQTIPITQTTCYRRKVTSGTCGTDYSNAVTVTVFANLTSGTVVSDQTICYNTSPAAFTETVSPTGGNGSYTYQWQSQPLCTGGWGDISGATASTYDVPGNITQTTCYRRQVISGACGSSASASITVTVYADLTPGSVAADQTICYSISPAPFTQITASTGGNGTYAYQWQEQPGCTGVWTDIAGAMATTYDVPGNIAQTTCYKRLVTSGTCGTVSSTVITVTLYGTLTPGAVAADQTICYNTMPATFTNVTSPGGGNGIYTYQWQLQPGCSGAWTDIAGATSDIYTQTTPITQTTCFRRKVTSGSCGTDYSNAVTITVYADLISGAVAADQTICYNTSPAAFTETLAPTGGNGSYIYQWQSQPGCIGGWGDISGATASTYDVPGNILLTTCYRRNVTSGICGTVATAAITVTVFADLTPGSIAADQTICNNTSPSAFTQITAATGGNGTYAYQWQEQPGCTGAWTDIAGATATTYDVSGNITQTTCYRRQIVSGASCGTVYSNSISVTFYAVVTPGSVASDQTICYNSTPATFTNMSSPGGGIGFYTYQWQIQPGCSGAWTDIPGATSDVFTQTTPLVQTSCYRRQASSGACGTAFSNAVTVTVYNNLTPGIVIADQTICYNTSPTAFTVSVAPTGGNGSYTYQWQSQPGCSGGWGDIAGATASTYQTGNLVFTICYRRELICGSCGTVASPAITVTVYADLTSGSVAADQTICYNTSPAPFTQTSASAGGNGSYTYKWQEQPGCTGAWTDIAGATATTYDVPGNISQTTCYRRQVTSGICGTVSTTVITVTVFGTLNPGAIATDQTICYNSMPATFTNTTSPSGGNGLYAYQWQIQPGCTGVWTDIVGATSNIYTQTTPITQTTCYKRKVTSGTCGTDYSNAVTVTVFANMTPGTVLSDQTICYNTSPAAFTEAVPPTGGNGTYTYQWQSQPLCIGGWGDIAGATASTYDVPGNITQTTCYRRQVISGACGSSATASITVTVYADLTAGNVAADQTLCYNTSPAPFTQITASTGGNGSYTYQWQAQPGCTGVWTDIVSATATTYDVPGNITQTTCYRREVTSGTCGTVATAAITITVFGTLTPGTIAADQTLCYNTMPSTFTNITSPSGGNGFYAYQWQAQPGCSGAWADIAGATSDIYTQTTPLTQTTCFRRKVTSGICGTDYSNTVTVTVFTNLTPGAVTVDQTICYNTSPAAFTETIASTGGNGTYTYQWQEQPGCTGTWTDITSATATTYDVPGNIIQTTCYRRQVTSGTCGTLSSNVITVTVYPDLTPGTVGYNQSLCYDSIAQPFLNIALASGGSGVYAYQWQIQPGCSGSWSDISGATGTTYAHSSPMTLTTCFRRVVINTCGILNSNIITINVFSYTPVSFTGLHPQYCTDAAAVLLTGTPSGGTFSGAGIAGNYFYPNIAGSGLHNITYTYIDPNGCMNFQTQQVTVYDIPVVSFTGLLSNYCVDAPAATLTGSPAGGTFSGTGIIGNIFNPSLAGPGTYAITYTYIDAHTCTNSSSQTVTVYALPVVGLLGLSNSYCIDNPPAHLTGLPSGGTFSGAGMSGNIFDPASAGVGAHSITYTYTDSHGCTNSTTLSTTVYDLPVVSFTGLQSPYCTYSSPETLTGTPSGGTFSGPGIIGDIFYPNIAGAGTFNIIYSYTDGNSCLNHDTQTVVVYAQPIVSFSGLNTDYCVDATSSTLTGTPLGGTFSGAGMSGNVFSPSGAGAGTHTITYSFTSSNGCNESSSQLVIVHPLPVVFISGLSPAYCVDAAAVSLNGSPAGGNFTGPGMIGNIFNPGLAGPGTHTITYHFTDGNLCYNTFSQTIIVNALPIVTFTGLAPHYCPYEVGLLQGIPLGGTFTGPGMVGNLFYASISGVGTQQIVYTFVDSNNCLNTDTQITVVSALVPVNIIGLATDYCVNNPPAVLTGSPSGGTFTGPGMNGNTFYPDSAGIGIHTINYASSDSLGCINDVSEIVIVHGLPTVDFYGLDSSYCLDALPSLLTGLPAGGTFSGPGVSGNHFYPDSAGTGIFTITYNYADNFTCINHRSRTVIVNPLPIVNITNLQNSYCYNTPPIALSGTPAGGTFTGTGVFVGYFYPVVSGVGTFNVTYTYTDGNSCVNYQTKPVIILPVPAITSTDTVFTCSGQSVNYTIASSLSGTTYTWTSSLILGSATGYNSGSAAVIGDTLINNTLSAALVKYIITPTSSGIPACTGDPFVLIVNVRPYPTVYAGHDAQICSNTPYTVMDATTDPSNIINWTTNGLGTFNNSSLMHPTYIPSTSEFGNISLYMTVTNLLGCPKTDTMVLSINYAPIAHAGGNHIINCGGSGIIMGSPAQPNYLYNWSPATGLSNPNIAQPMANPASNTIYILTVTDTVNGCSDLDTAVITVNGAPFADAGINQNVNCGGAGVVIGSLAINGMSYSWSPISGLNNPNIAQPTAAPLSTTTYMVTVTDLATGCFNTDNVTITVIGAPTANAGPDQTINCGNSIGVVIGSPAVSGMSYSWQPATGLNNPNAAQPVALPSANTTYVLTVTNMATGCFATDDITITVLGAPSANAGFDQSISCGSSTGVTIGTPQVSGLSYNWLPSNGLSDPNIAQPIATPLTNTTYHLIVTDLLTGCYAADEVDVSVIASPVANAGTDQTISCGGVGINIGAASVIGMSYSWSPSNTLSNANIAQPTATPLSSTTYTLTVTNMATGCYNTDDVTITVVGAPVATAGIDAAVNCGTGISVGSVAVAGMSYIWIPSLGLNNPNIAQPIATPHTTTNYTLIVTNMATGCYATDDINITVIGAPLADAGPNQTIGCGSSGTTVGTPSVAGLSYSWTPSYALSATNIAQPTANPSGNTTYYLTVTDLATGCYGVDTVNITVSGAPVAHAGIDHTISCGSTGTTIGTPGLTGYSYTWSPVSGLNNPNIAQPVANPLGNTLYQLTVTDLATGCFGTDDVNISVSGAPVANAGLNQSIPCGGPGVVIGTTGVIGVSYTWNPAYGLNNINIAQPTATPYVTTNYVLTAKDLATGCIATDDVLVTVVGMPSVYAGSDASVCANNIYLINDATSSNVNVLWTHTGIGNITNYTTLSPTYLPLPNEFGTVIMTLTAVCNTDTATDNMILTIYPYPVATFSGLDSAYCTDNPGSMLSGYPAGGTFSGPGLTGDFFSPSAAGIGVHQITYTFQDANGCIKDTSMTTIVNPTPVVSFTGLASHYCAYDAAYLIGTPAGGVFTGPGMVGNMFYANVSGVGTFYITYTYMNAYGCMSSQTQQTTVTAIPSTNFSGLASQYCIDASPVTLIGTPVGGTFTGPGITGSIFSPAVAGPGPHSIDYSYNDSSSCISNSTQNVMVYALPIVQFSGLNTAYCIDGAPVVLNGFPSGGTFSGQGIADSTFHPSVAGVGTHTITYTYTDIHGCTNTHSENVIIHPLPVVTLSALNSVCVNAVPFALYGGLPIGGTYTGNGVLNNMFYPATVGVGTYQITYTYTDNFGCINFTVKPITVNPLPVVSFSGLASYYCFTNTTVTLTGTPSGGIFSGAGIVGNTFHPVTAGIGFHSITYTFTNSNTCTSSQTQLVEVKALPVVDFSGLDTTYCLDAAPVTLSGFPGGGTFSGPGITDSTFTPSVAGSGIHTITYTYTDIYGCVNVHSQNVKINTLPVVTLAALNPVCVDHAPFALYGGLPSGGTYSGTGVINNIFNPALAGAGTHPITYTYTNNLGCTSFAVKPLTVNPLPVVTFTGLGTYYCNSSDSVVLTGNPSGGTFSGPGITGHVFNPLIAGVGFHSITYSYTDANTCTSTETQTVEVKALPVVNFGGLDPSYCIDAPIAQLTGYPSGGTFTGAGISGTTFSPSVAGAGTHVITYTYIDGFTCIDSTAQSVVVNNLPVVTFGSQAPLCVDALPIILNTGLPVGGTYSGPGVSNGQFDPAMAGVGTYALTYNYTDANSCADFATQTITVNPLPVVSFTGLAPFYCANSVGDTLVGIPSGGTFSGTGMNNNIFEPTVAGIGTQLITYTYTDNNSCTNYHTQNTDVKPLPQLSISGLDTSYCINSSPVYITGIPAGGSFSGPGISGNIFDPVAAGVGIYGIVYTYSDFYGCTNKDTTVVVVNALSILSITPVNPVCIDETPFLLQCVLPAGGTYSGQGVISGTFYPQTAGAGAHTIYYDYVDNNNCMISVSTVIIVNPLPVVVLTLPLSEMCTNDTLMPLYGGTPLGGTYSGTGITGSVFDPLIAGAGIHIITYTYTDSNGCTSTAQASLKVNQAPHADAGEDVAICAQTSVTLKATGGDFYVWNTNETTQEIVVSPVQTGTYTVTVYDAYNGCSEIDSVTVSIIPLPVVQLVTDAPSSILSFGQFVTFSAVPSTYNYYDFYMNTILAQSGPLSYYGTNMAIADTMITVIALNGTCISEPYNFKLNIKPIYNVFTPNGDGKNDFFMKGYDLSVMNRWGQLLYEGYDGWDGSFNGKVMPEGTYYYVIRFKDAIGNVSVTKGSITLYRAKN